MKASGGVTPQFLVILATKNPMFYYNDRKPTFCPLALYLRSSNNFIKLGASNYFAMGFTDCYFSLFYFHHSVNLEIARAPVVLLPNNIKIH